MKVAVAELAYFLIVIVSTSIPFVRGDEGPVDYAELDPARDPETPLRPGTSGPEVVALQNALAGCALL